jgi:DNA replication and repair protein RecF
MILTKLTLLNFRNYKKQVFQFTPDITLIVGANAIGKTNIVEAIYLLATAKSFHAQTESEMLAWEAQIGRVKADIGDAKLEVVVTNGELAGQKTPIKKYYVNGVSRRIIDFMGNLRAVLFWPEDLELVIGSPSLRRRFLDRVLAQTDREYRRNLFSYERGLRQRNRLLDMINEGKAGRNQLLFWNQLLIKAGNYITESREKLIEFINKSKSFDQSPQSDNDLYKLEYDRSVISEARLDQYKDEEVAAKVTLVGPHRDDFIINKLKSDKRQATGNNDYLSLNSYGSRGEQRLGVLWLKLAELTYVTQKTGDRPILLLDDVFSELDDEHRAQVLKLIKNQQTIITSAENDVLEILEKAKIPFQMINLPIM